MSATLQEFLHHLNEVDISHRIIGVYDVEYRIFVSSREAEVFTIKRGIEHLDRPTITLKSDIIGMIRISKQVNFIVRKHL